ncbi:hypothetical protein [uncultured Xanthomonas sp.]|uniref:hypothetical protein n=1 Tax=uncultured Xanthomonas sp. TaxID=152831 RepID=UPI0026001844|nr:hypothetical protein [uncultured Xanthomonas sp.]
MINVNALTLRSSQFPWGFPLWWGDDLVAGQRNPAHFVYSDAPASLRRYKSPYVAIPTRIAIPAGSPLPTPAARAPPIRRAQTKRPMSQTWAFERWSG